MDQSSTWLGGGGTVQTRRASKRRTSGTVNKRDATSGRWVSRVSGRVLGAVLSVDLFGHPADFDAIAEIVAPYGIPIVEDGAEGLGASCRGRRAGNLARVGALSFNGNKVITTGGGGMVVTDDEALAKRLRHLST